MLIRTLCPNIDPWPGIGLRSPKKGKKMKYSPEEQEIIERALAIIAAKLPAVDFMLSPEVVRNFLRLRLAPQEREMFGVIFLDNQNAVIAFETLFQGTINAVEVHPRIVAQAALKHNAAAVVLAHNHPSGSQEPSQADKKITERLVQALSLFNVRVIDHLIVAGNNFTSFAERGLL